MLDSLKATMPDRFESLERLLVVLALLAIAGITWALIRKWRVHRDASAMSAYKDMTAAFGGSGVGLLKRTFIALWVFLALCSLLVAALAKPVKVSEEPFEQATILPLLDTSNTARAVILGDPDSIPRIDRELQGLKDFLEQAPERMQVGLATFDTNVRVVVPPTTDRVAVQEAMSTIEIGKQTDIPNALIEMARVAERIPRADDGTIPARIVLFSDGKIDVQGQEVTLDEAIEFVNEVGIPVYTVAFGEEGEVTFFDNGDPVPAGVDKETMERIADGTGGKSLVTSDAASITSFYEEVGSSMGTREVIVPAQQLFVVFALVALVFVAVLYLLWFYQRKPRSAKATTRSHEIREEAIFRKVA